MGVASKYNKQKLFTFSIPSEYIYHTLSDLYKKNGKDMIYPCFALYINTKSRFGNAPIVATNECLVNLPSHLLETVKEMLRDEEVIDACNDGKFGFQIYQYESKQNKQINYSVNWVDM